jgi:uncharacterized membrane protein HdeD (DUF308 family)
MNKSATEVAQVCALAEPRKAWPWFVAFGVALILLTGFAALNVRTVGRAVYPAGLVMMPAAFAAIGLTLEIRSWGASGAWLLSALLYAAAALLAFNDLSLTNGPSLLLALMLMASGLMRMWWSMALRTPRGIGWMTASGAVSALAALILIACPNAAWLAALIFAGDAGVQGAAAIAFGWALSKV